MHHFYLLMGIWISFLRRKPALIHPVKGSQSHNAFSFIFINLPFWTGVTSQERHMEQWTDAARLMDAIWRCDAARSQDLTVLQLKWRGFKIPNIRAQCKKQQPHLPFLQPPGHDPIHGCTWDGLHHSAPSRDTGHLAELGTTRLSQTFEQDKTESCEL